MSSRGSRRSIENLDISNISTLQRLIFSQSVCEFGSDAWQEISKLLSRHPLTKANKEFRSPESCQSIYIVLMNEQGITRPDTGTRRHAKPHLQLAQRYYVARMEALKELIAAEEAKFKTIVSEIDAIRAGLWDDKILENLGGNKEDVEAERFTENAVVPVSTLLEDEYVTQNANGQENMDVDTQVERAPAPEPPVSDDIQILEVEAEDSVDVKEEEQEEDEVEPIITEASGDMEEGPKRSESPRKVTSSAEETSEEAIPEVEQEGNDIQEEIEEDGTPAYPDTDMAASPAVSTPARSDSVKRKVSDAFSESGRQSKRQREDSEVGDDEEPGPSTGRGRRRGTGAADKKFQNVIGMLHSTISQHRYGNIFHNPIKKADAPDYHDIVKRPMDLKTIKARVKDGLISNSLEFQRDICLMFANAMMYNRPGSEIHHMAGEMMLESERHINTFRQTEGFHRGGL